jgi:hypothetical protein
MSAQNRQSSSTEKPVGGIIMSTFLSSVSMLLSAIALGVVGFALAQTLQLQQNFRELNASGQRSPAASKLPQAVSSLPIPTTEPSQITNAEPTQQVNAEIQPGQFVQYAFKDKAQVELLAVKRIQNPEDGTRNVVNVQMRIRELKDGSGGDVIVPDQTKARDPETSETYEAYDVVAERANPERKNDQRSSGVISMFLAVKTGSSVDCYVWMSIPEKIKTIDLLVPNTEEFLKVPISE